MYHTFSSIYTALRDTLTHDFNTSYYTRMKNTLSKQLLSTTQPHKYDPQKLVTLKETLSKNIHKYFTCLSFPNVPCDNNKAERALRHLVIKRRTSFGSKTTEGAETTAIPASVLLSLKHIHPQNFFQKYLLLRGENMA